MKAISVTDLSQGIVQGKVLKTDLKRAWGGQEEGQFFKGWQLSGLERLIGCSEKNKIHMATKALQWQRGDCIIMVNESRHQNKGCLRPRDLQRVKNWTHSGFGRPSVSGCEKSFMSNFLWGQKVVLPWWSGDSTGWQMFCICVIMFFNSFTWPLQSQTQWLQFVQCYSSQSSRRRLYLHWCPTQRLLQRYFWVCLNFALRTEK